MDLNKIQCKKCKYWRKIYIHPCSEGIPQDLKASTNGFACILPLNKGFIESFNKRESTIDDFRVDVMIGKDNSVGCECFTEI